MFTGLTFTIPLVLGMTGGLIVGYGFTAAVLLGSLWASYTLVVYPVVRNMGLAGNPAVATTVGATVLTDTMALVMLAFVAGSTSGDANGFELLVQIVLGLALLAAYCFLLLPVIARWFFRGIGTPRTLRYAFMFAALLSAGALAEVVGIEAIVGAFFGGLALNRLVPNEGEFMERIEFFGSALLIPMFLVSVGTVIDPSVLVDPATIGLAAVFVVACVGGKAIAALLCRPLLGFTPAETGVVFGLSVGQAAATLAATFVGLNIGLFTTTTVNAVMMVIVVSLVLASFAALRFGSQMEKPPLDESRLGRVVVTHVDALDDVRSVLGLAARLADADSGVVRPTFIVPDGDSPPGPEVTDVVAREIDRLGIDAHLDVRHDRSVTDGLLHTIESTQASLVVVPAATQSWLPTLFGASQHALVAASSVPSALVRRRGPPAGARRARAVDDPGQAPEQCGVAGRHAGRPPPAQRARCSWSSLPPSCARTSPPRSAGGRRPCSWSRRCNGSSVRVGTPTWSSSPADATGRWPRHGRRSWPRRSAARSSSSPTASR